MSRPGDRIDNSYDPERTAHGFAAELERLRAQAALSWPIEQRRLMSLGVADSQTILDLGCGPGWFSAQLSEWLPAARLTGVDADIRMVQAARHTLARHILAGRAKVVNADAAATGLERSSIDTVLSRYLFQHLEDPTAVAVEALRVLRPGGRHIVIDVDDAIWGIAEPAFEQFGSWHALLAQAQAERGGNRRRGRQLARILRDAGYVHVHLDVFAYDSDELGLASFKAQFDPDQFLPLVAEGRMGVTDYAQARLLLERFVTSPNALLIALGVIAYGEAPV